MKVKSEREVAQSCLTLRDPMDSVHGIFQARVLEGGAIAFSDMDSRKVVLRNLFAGQQQRRRQRDQTRGHSGGEETGTS